VAVRIWVGSHALSVPRPDWTTLRSLRRSLAAHNWLNLSLQMPVLLVPVLAASILAPSVNAAYYVATTILSALFILPAHMSTVLFAMGAADPGELPGRLRFGLRVSLLVGLAGMIVLGVGAHFILGVFGAGYAQVATLPLRIMVLAYLPNVPNLFYIAVARATNKLSRAARLVSVFTVLNISAVVFGAVKYGVIGVAVAGLAVGTVEALVTTPIVLRAASGLGRHRRAATAAVTSSAAVGLRVREQRLGDDRPSADVAHRERQLRALGVLMSLATPNTVTMMAISDDTPRPRMPTPAPLADPGDFEHGERTV
jgi:Na+-driven multidrug efflux pump